jgi:hypothetical protein
VTGSRFTGGDPHHGALACGIERMAVFPMEGAREAQ